MSYYLTRIKLNDSRRPTWKILNELEPLHAIVEKMFPSDDGGRILWRIDNTYAGNVLYVLSQEIPDATGVVEQFGWPRLPYEDQVRTVRMDKFFSGLEVGQRFGFRVAVNPVRYNGKTRKGTLIVGKRALDLITEKMEANGFSIASGALRQADESHRSLWKNGRRSTRVITSFEGILTIEDPEKAFKALTCGIGRMKAYGAGLLTLAKI